MGWTVTGPSIQAQPSKASDLLNFGKLNKGPGSVFAGKKNEIKESISRTARMISMLSSQNVETINAMMGGMFLGVE